jgi:hypothetical protein
MKSSVDTTLRVHPAKGNSPSILHEDGVVNYEDSGGSTCGRGVPIYRHPMNKGMSSSNSRATPGSLNVNRIGVSRNSDRFIYPTYFFRRTSVSPEKLASHDSSMHKNDRVMTAPERPQWINLALSLQMTMEKALGRACVVGKLSSHISGDSASTVGALHESCSKVSSSSSQKGWSLGSHLNSICTSMREMSATTLGSLPHHDSRDKRLT